jgi:PAS domain S-box-containing protein
MVIFSIRLSGLKFPRTLSLRWVLTSVLVGQILLTGGVIGGISFLNGQRQVAFLARELTDRVSHHAQDHLDTFLTALRLVNQRNRDHFEVGLLDWSDPALLERFLHQQILAYTTVNTIRFASPEGGIVAAGRERSGAIILERSQNFPTPGPYIRYPVDSQGNLGSPKQVTPMKDARTRHWFQEAKATQTLSWTQTNVIDRDSTLALTASRPLFDPQGKWLGVGSVDIYLAEISDFLEDLQISRSGLILVVDEPGNLIATSSQTPVTTGTEADTRLLKVNESSHPFTRKVANALRQQIGESRQLEQEQYLTLTVDSQRQFVQVSPFPGPIGLDWSVIVVAPESALIGSLNRDTTLTILFSLLFLGLSALLAVWISRWISRPIRRLSRASDAIAQGSFTQLAEHSNLKDLEQIIQAFNKMVHQLEQSFTTLEQQVRDRTQSLQQEIEQRQQTEFALRQNEQVLSAIFDNIQQYMGLLTPSGELLSANRASLESIQATLDDVLGHLFWQTPWFAGQPDLQQKIQEMVRQAANGQSPRQDLPTATPAGIQIFETTMSPVWDETGAVRLVIPEARDVTEERAAQQLLLTRTAELSQTLEQLKLAQHELVESAKLAALGDLVAGVAHEINTPIGTAIIAGSTLENMARAIATQLADDTLTRSSFQNYIEVAQESSRLILSNLNRAGELVQSIKRVAVDQASYQCRTFAVKSYLQEVIISLSPKLKHTHHTITVNGDDALTIQGYPGILAQIVTNFILNSLTHAYPTDQAGQIRLEVTQQDEMLQLVYHDDGCGIPSEALPQIFEPFFTTARHRGGSGLGLYLVFTLVTQKLRGAIQVSSSAQTGTTFTVTLPTD